MGIANGILTIIRGVVYGAREAHNLTGWVQLPAPQQRTIRYVQVHRCAAESKKLLSKIYRVI